MVALEVDKSQITIFSLGDKDHFLGTSDGIIQTT